MEWISLRYGIEQLKLNTSLFSVTVTWDSTVRKGEETGYKFYINNRPSRKFYQNIDDAKNAAVQYLKISLVRILANLER